MIYIFWCNFDDVRNKRYFIKPIIDYNLYTIIYSTILCEEKRVLNWQQLKINSFCNQTCHSDYMEPQFVMGEDRFRSE